MTLGYVFLALILISFIFFIIDGIISPSENMLLRFSLYKTVDEIEDLKGVSGVNRDVTNRLRGISLNLINHMPRFNLITLAALRVRLEKDEAFREESAKRVSDIKLGDNQEAKDILDHIVKIGDKVLFWNSVGWMVSLVPIAIVWVLFEKFQAGVKLMITMSQKNFDKLDSELAC